MDGTLDVLGDGAPAGHLASTIPRRGGLISGGRLAFREVGAQTQGAGNIVSKLRTLAWWIWPIVPAIAGVLLVAGSADTERWCPPYGGPFTLPPHPEQCLPTLLPSLTGTDPLAVGLSWLIVGAVIYAGLLAATAFVRTRGFR